MSAPAGTGFGPCADWPPLWCCELPTGSAPVSGYALTAATEALWQASGQRYGPCPLTVRPCRRDCAPGAGPWWPWPGGQPWPLPWLHDGVWTNITCGGCPDGCACTTLSQAVLPAPVHQVGEVRVDGAVLDPSAYRVDDWRTLVRLDGGSWPACQDLTAPPDAPGTWSVTLTVGEPVPTLGRQAVGELTCEIVRACLGEDCTLPANVVSLARQGITLTFPGDGDPLRRLYLCRLFLDTANPHRLSGRPRVYDLDAPAARHTDT